MFVDFNRDFIDNLLYEFAKNISKKYKNIPIDITIVGGAAILLQAEFRDTTEDIDIVKDKLLDIKQSLIELSDSMNISYNSINDNFMYSKSFSRQLYKYSKLYKKIRNVSFYIVDLKAIACMKMIAGRKGTNDLTDIENIIEVTSLSKEEAIEILTTLYGAEYSKMLNIDIDFLFSVSKLDLMLRDANNKR